MSSSLAEIMNNFVDMSFNFEKMQSSMSQNTAGFEISLDSYKFSIIPKASISDEAFNLDLSTIEFGCDITNIDDFKNQRKLQISNQVSRVMRENEDFKNSAYDTFATTQYLINQVDWDSEYQQFLNKKGVQSDIGLQFLKNIKNKSGIDINSMNDLKQWLTHYISMTPVIGEHLSLEYDGSYLDYADINDLKTLSEVLLPYGIYENINDKLSTIKDIFTKISMRDDIPDEMRENLKKNFIFLNYFIQNFMGITDMQTKQNLEKFFLEQKNLSEGSEEWWVNLLKENGYCTTQPYVSNDTEYFVNHSNEFEKLNQLTKINANKAYSKAG